MKRLIQILFAISLILSFLGNPVFAEDAFEKGNQFYSEGQYELARQSYEEALLDTKDSYEIYFNLGNTYLNLGEIVQAKIYYMRAQQLRPRNKFIDEQLDFISRLVAIKMEDNTPWFQSVAESIFNQLTYVEMKYLFHASLTLVLIFFILRRILYRKKWIRWAYRILLVLFLFFAAVYLGYIYWKGGRQPAVLIETGALRYTPSLTESKVTQVEEGLDLIVIDRRESWSKVVLKNQERGWILNEMIEII